jgi:hypothetical protein
LKRKNPAEIVTEKHDLTQREAKTICQGKTLKLYDVVLCAPAPLR